MKHVLKVAILMVVLILVDSVKGMEQSRTNPKLKVSEEEEKTIRIVQSILYKLEQFDSQKLDLEFD